jgi:hypothetical protein
VFALSGCKQGGLGAFDDSVVGKVTLQLLVFWHFANASMKKGCLAALHDDLMAVSTVNSLHFWLFEPI